MSLVAGHAVGAEREHGVGAHLAHDLEHLRRARSVERRLHVDVDEPLEGAIGTIESPDDLGVLEPEVAPEPAAPTLERPDAPAGRLRRLRARLARSNSALGQGLLSLLSRGKLDEATWEEVEDTLLAADLGVAATTQLVDPGRLLTGLDEMFAVCAAAKGLSLQVDRDGLPA